MRKIVLQIPIEGFLQNLSAIGPVVLITSLYTFASIDLASRQLAVRQDPQQRKWWTRRRHSRQQRVEPLNQGLNCILICDGDTVNLGGLAAQNEHRSYDERIFWSATLYTITGKALFLSLASAHNISDEEVLQCSSRVALVFSPSIKRSSAFPTPRICQAASWAHKEKRGQGIQTNMIKIWALMTAEALLL